MIKRIAAVMMIALMLLSPAIVFAEDVGTNTAPQAKATQKAQASAEQEKKAVSRTHN